jgi:hypothetical protein
MITSTAALASCELVVAHFLRYSWQLNLPEARLEGRGLRLYKNVAHYRKEH